MSVGLLRLPAIADERVSRGGEGAEGVLEGLEGIEVRVVRERVAQQARPVHVLRSVGVIQEEGGGRMG
eukprot:768277-Hanusia_phi.AAC.2